MYKSTQKNYTSLFFITTGVFFLGVVLGSMAYFSVRGVSLNITESLMAESGQSYEWTKLFKRCFITEVIWVTLPWLMAQINFVAPFACAVMGLRGFTTGFTVSFVLGVKEGSFTLLRKSIIPQCLFGLPLLTFVTVLSIIYAIEDKRTNALQMKCILLEVVAVFLSAVVALIECLFASVL